MSKILFQRISVTDALGLDPAHRSAALCLRNAGVAHETALGKEK